MSKSCVLLLSGGLDSATCLAIAKNDGFEIHALSFEYGQRHSVEIACAKRLSEHFNVASHRIISIELGSFGGSALTENIDVPKNRNLGYVENEIPITYVPARNTIFLSYALGLAEVLGTGDIFIGVNALDYSGYPDCRPEYIEAFQKMANFAVKKSVLGEIEIHIHTPLIQMTKSEIIQKGILLGVDYSMTISCYDPVNGVSCGECDACQLRLNGFRYANVSDTIPYRSDVYS